MNKIQTAIVTLSAAAIFLSGRALAVEKPPVTKPVLSDIIAALPPELLYNEKPIEPYCFAHFDGDSSRYDPLDLKDCHRISKDYDDKGMAGITPGKLEAQKDGSIGYEYTYQDSGGGPYVYYRYLGKLDGLPTLFISTSGGGSGHFTNIVSVSRDGDQIKLAHEFTGGDRCNGGVSDAGIENGKLVYNQSVTPYEFLTLAQDNPYEIKAYEGLEASAASCFGEVWYSDGKPVSITLKGYNEDQGADQSEWTEKFAYQSCFNKLYRGYVEVGKTVLTMEELKEFTRKFNEVCVKEKQTKRKP